MAMNEIERIVDQLEREYAGESWHGPPLREILDGVDHTMAAARPLEGPHTIWEIVLHITAWKNEARNRLAGSPAGDPREGDWRTVGDPTPERWQEALADLETAHRLLVSAVREFPEQNLHVPTNDVREDGLSATNYELLMGILQHDVYHSGQIALLRRALRAR